MIEIKRTHSDNLDFIALEDSLNAYLKVKDGAEHDFYNQYNNIDVLKHVVVVYLNNRPVAFGAFKTFNENSVEVKRMYTDETVRGQGLASKVLFELEKWAKELDYSSTILETGKRQIEAVSFYKKTGYYVVPNYGQYIGIDNSVCFKKDLT